MSVSTISIASIGIVREIIGPIGKAIYDEVFLAVEFFCWRGDAVETLPKPAVEQVSSCRVVLCSGCPQFQTSWRFGNCLEATLFVVRAGS